MTLPARVVALALLAAGCGGARRAGPEVQRATPDRPAAPPVPPTVQAPAARGCRADLGCADREIALAPCASTPRPVDVADLQRRLLRGRGRVGDAVSVRGTIYTDGPFCTAGACRQGDCCAACGGHLYLGPPGLRGADSETQSLLLTGQVGEVPIGCGGDNTLTCCALPVGSVVSVEAHLGSSSSGFTLDVDAACR